MKKQKMTYDFRINKVKKRFEEEDIYDSMINHDPKCGRKTNSKSDCYCEPFIYIETLFDKWEIDLNGVAHRINLQ